MARGTGRGTKLLSTEAKHPGAHLPSAPISSFLTLFLISWAQASRVEERTLC